MCRTNEIVGQETEEVSDKMTWEELVEFAKDYGFIKLSDSLIRDLEFRKNGDIEDGYNGVLVMHRTYEQMKAIIENMFDKEK